MRIKGIRYGDSGGNGVYKVWLDGAVSFKDGPAPVSFTGCWKLASGMHNGSTLCLQQDNSGRVTATNDFGPFEGTISGNTLRFTHRPTGDYRSGRLIMDNGGKSFRGYWHLGNDTELNEGPVTGILTPPPQKK
jgi:hypothetical protein